MMKKKTVGVDGKGLEEGDEGGGGGWRVGMEGGSGIKGNGGVLYNVVTCVCVCECPKAYALHMIWKIHMMIG
jgi:hypothetical protein